MKISYNSTLKRTTICVVGFMIFIEYRPKLKCFDLVFYPNMGKRYGQSQFYEKYLVRSADFIDLVTVIIKSAEEYINSNQSFYDCLKHFGSELILIEALRKLDAPAHSSNDANSLQK